jgi:hypothetical protein
MITRHDALTADMFHDSVCRKWSRNGATQTWKTRPNDFRVPVKYGMYRYAQIWHHDAALVHLPGSDQCQKPEAI